PKTKAVYKFALQHDAQVFRTVTPPSFGFYRLGTKDGCLMQGKVVTQPRTLVVEGKAIESVRVGLSASQRRRLMGLIGPVALLVLWQGLVMAGILNDRFFPTPVQVVQQIFADGQNGELFHDVGISLYRILLGFVFGAVPGLVLGLSMGLFGVVRAIFDPIVSALMPIPKLALMPLIMVLFGLGETEKIVVIMLGVVFPVIVNTAAGVRNIDRQYMDVAKNFGASKLQYYRTVALPGALSMIFTGLKLGIGMAVLLIVAAEMHGALSGIGYRLWFAYSMFSIPQMYESFVLLALLGYLFLTLVDEVEHWLIPWKR
ncbi:MAG: ABC transporter permease, partial [Alicyclobacillus sp.]|nr:ABC transporter permease [Alicyclobacillus sp.]